MLTGWINGLEKSRLSCWSDNVEIADEATRKREFGNLRQIADNYPKYVISATPMLKRRDEEGIVHIHLREFLKDETL